MPDTREVADRLDIIEICTATHWCYDHDDWAGLDATFADVVSTPTLAQARAADFDVETYLDHYLIAREDLKHALRSIKDGLLTQHLVAGHRVTLDGDRAVCRAHSINVHLPAGAHSDRDLLMHGNEYRFDLVRSTAGWRIRGWVPTVRWSYGDAGVHDADAKQRDWTDS